MHACKYAFTKKCAYPDRVRAREVRHGYAHASDTLLPSSCPPHTCMDDATHLHTHVQGGRTAVDVTIKTLKHLPKMDMFRVKPDPYVDM